MEPSRSASSPAVPRRAPVSASFVSPSSNFLYTVDFLNELQSPSVSSKLPRSPSTPGRVPTTFNPDDFFASPPAAAAASASASASAARRAYAANGANAINLNSIPEGSTTSGGIGNTPQCKRRLFLESSNSNNQGNNHGNNHSTPVRQVLASPAGSSGSLFTFGNLDTPRAASASGKKRSRRFPSSDHMPPPFIFSPHRNVLPPANSILMPSPKLFQTPKDSHSGHESIIGTDTGNDHSNDSGNKNAGLSLTLTPKNLDKSMFHTPKPLNMSMVNSATAAATAIHLEEGSSAVKPQTSSQIFMTPITPVESCNTCRCKASRCLKLYCPCFAASRLCSAACSCKNCQNTQFTSKIIQEARNTVLQRDPKAFDPKVRPVNNGNRKTTTNGNGNGNGNTGAIHSKGCNCRKGCAKNYCVCRELRVACGPRCTCSGPNGCLNGKDCGEDKCNPNGNANGNVDIAPGNNNNNGGLLRPPVPPPKSEPIVSVLKRVSTVPIDALRANDNNNTQGLFKQLRKQYHDTQQHAPLFPPVTPEKMKTDMLALASSPATRSPRVRSVARIQHHGNNMNGSKINFNSHEALMSQQGNVNSMNMMEMQQQKTQARPPRILRVKMGSGRALRKLAIGSSTHARTHAPKTDYTA